MSGLTRLRTALGFPPVHDQGQWEPIIAATSSTTSRTGSTGTLPYLVSGSGEPLLYLPGLTTTHRLPTGTDRVFQLSQIAPYTREREVWWVNRRTGIGDGVTLSGLARDYAAFVADRLDPPVDVLGLSTGGSVALWLAAEHPDLVRRLVIVSAAHRLSPLGRAAQRVTAESARCGRTRISSCAMFVPLGSTPRSRSLLGALGFVLGPVPSGRGDDDMVATLEAEDVADVEGRLGDITAPTLLVAGDHDGYFDRSQYEHTASTIPDCELVLLPGKGHLPTHVPVVSAPVLEFLADRHRR
ncbi:alpha/beta fold hydrolase [Saccharomonospora xinjiangensis]|uniref:Putative hydrolase or acyltransferase of alpha/beta superfamily n=1 Tax=Saccharomonospora xinjiangensis XJ-54 TaxID=882086 RepID=I0V7G6_9PSEU|nr:alpha/beta fold hydrolase [Saccharomonospora xinjiangensis]EID56069.1 putative hydrolase or acyltransferase of alpha/beta superfamily [Saccharomonospora xinjiangensis XJ-54]